MKNIYIKGLVEKTGENEYKIIASTACIDRQGDVIDQNGWLTENYMKNPVMLWAHDYSELPVAKCTKLEVIEQQLVCSFQFASAEGNPKAAQIKTLYDEGFMNAVSVGFIPKEQNGNVITKAELLEISFVPVPANQEALRLAMSKGLDISLVEKDLKGEVADVLEQEEQTEMKYEKWAEVVEAISAMWTVYFMPETPVEDFSKLLTETIELLQVVADNDGIDADDTESKAVAGAKSKESVTKFIASISEKAGREISAANHEKIKMMHEHMTKAVSVAEEMMASTQGEGGKAGDKRSVAEKELEDEKAKATAKNVLNARSGLVAVGKNFELVMRLLNEAIGEKR